MSINVKHAKKWVRAAAKNRLHIIRDEDRVIITDGCAVLIVRNSTTAWEILQALPVPVPEKAGAYLIRYGSLTDGSHHVLTVVRQHVEKLTQPAHDTRLIYESRNSTIRVIYVNGQYTLIDTKYFDLFGRGLKLRGLDRKHAITFYDGDTLIGMALPLITDSIPRYLADPASIEDANS